MKNLSALLLAIAVVLFLTSSSLFMYRFGMTHDFSRSDVVMLAATGTIALAILIMRFVLSRAKAGIGIIEISDKDRTQLREIRRELNIWRFASRILAGIGFVFMVTGFMLLLDLNASGRPNWRGSIVCFVFGGILILPAILVIRRDRLSK